MFYVARPLDMAWTADEVDALLRNGADPTLQNSWGWIPLMHYIEAGLLLCVERVLEDPRMTTAAVNTAVVRGCMVGYTPLHMACDRSFCRLMAPCQFRLIQLLLRAGANPTLVNARGNAHGHTPLDLLGTCVCTQPARTLLQEAKHDHDRVSFILKVRRMVVVATDTNVRSRATWARARITQGKPLPEADLVLYKRNNGPVTRHRRQILELRKALAFVVGLDDGCTQQQQNKTMPTGVFVNMMEMLLPWST